VDHGEGENRFTRILHLTFLSTRNIVSRLASKFLVISYPQGILSSGFWIPCCFLRVLGSGFSILELGIMVSGLWLRGYVSGVMVKGLWFWGYGLGVMVLTL
jgi:hypothetical protein